jgi:DNA-binding IclR family transcriptional regulator
MTRGRHAQLVAALDEGEKSTSELVERLHVHRTTVRRLLQELLAEGEAEQTVRGRYRRAGARPLNSWHRTLT